MLTSTELRKKYLNFFESKGHKVIPSASLIPENDPTVLFTTAGMHPLVPYLLGQAHPEGTRLTNVQKCVRTQDIDEVGDNRHQTFFEMLGNWSLGDYFKEDAIKWSYEFLTSPNYLGLDVRKLAVTVFAGETETNIPRDNEAAQIWKDCGIPEHKIAYLPRQNNWWGPAGVTGPCGPDTEMFFWRGETEFPPENSNPGTDEDNWLEIWNDVFMQYNKNFRTILVDGMFALYDKDFVINEKVLEMLNSFPQAKKILVVNGYGDKAKEIVSKFGFDVVCYNGEIKKDNPEFFTKLLSTYNLKADDILYFDHAQENLVGAKLAGINSVKLFSDNIKEIKDFLSANLFIYEPLKQKNVDTGMGLERTLVVLNGLNDVFQIDTFWPIIEKIQEISGHKYGENESITKSMRVVGDHLRTATMIMGDDHKISPSNVDQGYIVRRLIRRAIRHGRNLEINQNFCAQISEQVINIFADIYPEVKRNREFVLREMEKEETKFRNTLEQGIREIEKMSKETTKITGKQAFDLYQSSGFPIEMTQEFAKENNLEVDLLGFEEEFKKHQELSRAGAEQKFKGGLADTSEMSTKYHTATHLLHAALRAVLGTHVEQRGSNITAERLRFDFSHPAKMTDEEKKRVEDLVNYAIAQNYPVSFEEMTVAEAKELGAMGLFEDKYGNKVKVYSVGDPKQKPSASEGSPTFSKEICGGPHVTNTGSLGKFKIIKEEAVSAGIRRIKAVLE